MDYRSVFDNAMSQKLSEYTFSDNRTIMNNIEERARRMEKNKQKRYSIFSAAAGTAAVVAVIGGSVFGLNYLNEHGGLKEGGAGYSANDTAVPEENTELPEYINLDELAGQTFEFSDLTVKIHSAQYDGKYLRLDYEGISEDPHMRGNFVLESTVYGYFSSSESDFARYWRDGEGEADRESDNVTLIMEVPQSTYQYMYFVPAYYKSDDDIERKDGIRVCARAAFPDPAYLALGGDETAMFPTVRMRVSPLVLKTVFKTDTDMSFTDMRDSLPSITAVYPDGSQQELEAGLPKPEDISGEQWWSTLYVPVSADAPSLHTAEKVIMDGEEVSFDLLSTGELTDITEAAGEKLEFDDMSAEILNVEYDGHFLRIIYKADYNGKPTVPERDSCLGIHEYQTSFKRHWFNGTAKMPELGDDVYMVTYELELEPGESTERLAFEYYQTDQPYEESRLQRTGFRKVTGIDNGRYFAAQTDIDGIKGIVISPLGAYILDNTGRAYFHAADSLILTYKDGTTKDFTIADGLSTTEYYTADPDHDTVAKFSYVMNALGLSDTSPDGLAVTTLMWSEREPIDVDNIAAIILDGTVIANIGTEQINTDAELTVGMPVIMPDGAEVTIVSAEYDGFITKAVLELHSDDPGYYESKGVQLPDGTMNYPMMLVLESEVSRGGGSTEEVITDESGCTVRCVQYYYVSDPTEDLKRVLHVGDWYNKQIAGSFTFSRSVPDTGMLTVQDSGEITGDREIVISPLGYRIRQQNSDYELYNCGTAVITYKDGTQREMPTRTAGTRSLVSDEQELYGVFEEALDLTGIHTIELYESVITLD